MWNGRRGTRHQVSGVVHVQIVDGVDIRLDREVVRQIQPVEVSHVADLEQRLPARRPSVVGPYRCVVLVRYSSRLVLEEHTHAVVMSEVVALRLVRIQVNLFQTVRLAIENRQSL